MSLFLAYKGPDGAPKRLFFPTLRADRRFDDSFFNLGERSRAAARHILTLEAARSLALNDGSVTYVAHSTGQEAARAAAAEGFTFFGSTDSWLDPANPNFWKRAVLLAEGRSRKEIAHNVGALCYRYRQPKVPAKLIFGFPNPNPGTFAKSDQFTGTFLGAAGAENYITNYDIADDGTPLLPGTRYRIAQDYVAGHFDEAANQFVSNPHYWGAIAPA